MSGENGAKKVRSGRMPEPIQQGVAAFVLAGGKSLRIGQDKAFLPWEGQTLLERALEATQAVASRTRIVGAKAKFEAYGSVVEDVFVDRGPLGAIHAALRATDREFNLVLAVDLPFATPALLTYLIGRAHETPCLATVPRLGGGWEPLCAVYRREFAEVAETALKRGQNAIYPLLEDGFLLEDGPRLEDGDDQACARAGVPEIGVPEIGLPEIGLQKIGVLKIGETELMAAGFGAWMFRNINTIRDLESCAKRSREPAGSTVLSSKGLNSE
jgi:molybdopterin-guanine dinucleotide biosynthesis protein A